MSATTSAAPRRAAASAARRGAAASEASEHWFGPLMVLVVGMFMTVLDTSIVNVAIPSIKTDFGGSTSDLAWIATAYTLVLGVVVPTSAWVGDKFGLARVYTLSLAGFAAASALCGLAWDLNSLIAFRVIQAIPGGLIPAITMAMIYRLVPMDKIGSAMGVYGLGVIAAPALGPTLGGYLVEYLNWRLVFYINVPVAVVGVLLALFMLPHFAQRPTYRFDVLGFLTIGGALVCLLLAFEEGADWGWTSYGIVSMVLGGVLLLALFVVIEFEVEHPMLDLRVLKNFPYVNSLLIMSITQIGLFATMFYVPVFLQAAMGLPALDAGIMLLPQGLVMAVMAPLSGRLYDRFGPRWLVFIGLLISAYGTYLFTGLNANIPRLQVVQWACIRAFGSGLSMMSIMTSGMSALPPKLTGSGTAINNVVQRVSGAFGLAVMSALVTMQQAQMAADGAALYPSYDARFSHLGMAGIYQINVANALTAMVGSYTDVFRITAAITVLAAFGALTMRSGPVKRPAGPGAAMME